MLLMDEARLGPTLRTVFLAYGVFWITALVVLFFAVGLLLRHAERVRKH